MATNGKKQAFTAATLNAGFEKAGETQIVKFDAESEPEIRPFTFEPIKNDLTSSYASKKERFGALAVTDPERATRSQRDRRFSLNPILKESLSVEEEERRVIEERMRQRIRAIEDEIKSKASEVGYQDGLKKGYLEAYLKFQKEGAERLVEFENLLAEAESAKVTLYRANERFLVELIYRIAKMVLLRELTTDREFVSRLAKDIVERVGVRDNIRIRLHPDDYETANLLREHLDKTLGSMKNVNVEASSVIKRGGCVVETDWNVTDASIEMQLQGVYDALIGKAPEESQQ